MMELLGILLPPFIDLVNSKVADSKIRFWISVLACTIVGTFINWITTNFVFVNSVEAAESISKSILVVFGIAQLSYQAVWNKSDMQKSLGLDHSNK